MADENPDPTAFHDPLVGPEAHGLPERFFDRFMFNMHPQDALAPAVIMGYGIYPPKDVADGFVVVTDKREQRNLRFAARPSETRRDGAAPFHFDIEAPNTQWRLRLGPNDIGVEFDVTWRARTPAWFGEVAVENTQDAVTSFDHLFQSGRYLGTLTIDGVEHSVDGWYGQRDRSRGLRTMAGGQGLHLWCQAQFPEFSIGFLLVETRTHERLLLKGAVMHEDGRLDGIYDVRHALTLDQGLDLTEAQVKVSTVSGAEYVMHADGRARGGYLAGAGYGGHHGRARTAEHVESDRYPLDGTVSPRTLDSALTDRLCAFSLAGLAGTGIFEFAVTRSRSYRYRASM